MKLLALALAAAATTAAKPPVTTFQSSQFGRVLATPTRQALYTWKQESDLKVHCTGACAKLWPPLYAKPGARVPAHVAGVKGTFGTIRRPDGRTQITWNRHPVYTYVHEGPNQVLCNNVGGWFVVRA